MKNRFAITAIFAATLSAALAGTGTGWSQQPKGGAVKADEKIAWTATRGVEVSDPVYQMTAYTLDVPANWKYAGIIDRPRGCHSNGAALKYTIESADGATGISLLPGVAWSWSSNPQMQRIMENSHCPGVEIDSAASFLVNIAVPNLRPGAKIVEVLPLLPAGQTAIAEQLEKARQQNAVMARQYGQQPQKLTKDGARVHVQYVRNGQPVEEMIISVIDCAESRFGGNMVAAPSTRLMCSSRGETILRAPQGRLAELVALPQFQALQKSLQPNQEWQARLAHDQQAAFQQMMAANNANFQQMMKNSEAQHEQLLANGRAFQQQQQESTNRAIAADRAHQAAMDESAHQTVLYALDRQEFRNPNTGEVIEASNKFNHQWISSDGSTVIQTDDHGFNPNGVVYPVSQSWTELVPK